MRKIADRWALAVEVVQGELGEFSGGNGEIRSLWVPPHASNFPAAYDPSEICGMILAGLEPIEA